MHRLSRKLGRPIHANLLRHTGAVRLLVNVMQKITLQQVLGHTILEMTRRRPLVFTRWQSLERAASR